MKNELIDKFKKYYEEHFEIVKKESESSINLRNEFIKEYPIERIKTLSLDEYILGDNKDNFCYKLEFGKYKNLCMSIKGNSSYKFGIYKSRDNKYYGLGKKKIEDPNKYWENLSNSIYSFLKDIDNLTNMFNASDNYPLLKGMPMVITKLASIYYPHKFIHMCSKNMLIKVSDYFGISINNNDSSEKISFDINKELYKLIPVMNNNDSFINQTLLYNYLVNNGIFAPEINSDNKNYWLYSPGENATAWNDCLRNGIMVLGWDELGNYATYKSKDEVAVAMRFLYNSENPRNNILAVYNFNNNIKIGDIIIAKQGTKKLLGYGIVKSDYYYDNKREVYKNIRKVEWIKSGLWCIDDFLDITLTQKTLTNITKYKNYPNKLISIIEECCNTGKKERYFWLNANPKIWSFSNINVGEKIEYTSVNDNGNKRRIYQNYLDAKKGDRIIAYESTPVKAIVGICEVEQELNNNALLIKKIEQLVNPISLCDIQKQEELKNIEYLRNAQGSLFKLEKEEYNLIYDMIREANPKIIKTNIKFSVDDFLNEVYITKENYNDIVNLIKRKKNIILQGAPGVGKTFMAKRLAYSLMGEKNDDRIEFIQFHQSYSYEDFIEGYRPTSRHFELVKGVFYNFCIKAGNDPDNNYYMIIDEINRGNLCKIFGELLMLIENDKRGDMLTLAYSKTNFSVPKNLYIIGMMNTADRSLAILDYALRRRFSFVEINPGFDNDNFKKYQNSFNDDYFNKTIDKIKILNKEISEDSSLGEGFMIGHSYFCNLEKIEKSEIKTIIKYDIIPILKEYWFDDEEKINEWSKRLLED